MSGDTKAALKHTGHKQGVKVNRKINSICIIIIFSICFFLKKSRSRSFAEKRKVML